jgi:MFS family permease
MLGLEAPDRMKATVFGFAGSFISFGNGAGPLAGGAVAAFLDLRWGLITVAAAAVITGLLVWVCGREPAVGRPD